MKTKVESYHSHLARESGPKAKTLGVRLGVTDREFLEKIKNSFDLAKSAGLELDVQFSAETS